MLKKILIPLFFSVLGCFLCVFVFLGAKVSRTGKLINNAIKDNDHHNLIKMEVPYYNESYLKQDLSGTYKYSIYEAASYEFKSESDLKHNVNRKTKMHEAYYIIFTNFNFDPLLSSYVVLTETSSYSFKGFFPEYFKSEFNFEKMPIVSLCIFKSEELTSVRSINFLFRNANDEQIGSLDINFDVVLKYDTPFFNAINPLKTKYNEYVEVQDKEGAAEAYNKFYNDEFISTYTFTKADPSYFSRQTGAFPFIITVITAVIFVIISGVIVYFMLFKRKKDLNKLNIKESNTITISKTELNKD